MRYKVRYATLSTQYKVISLLNTISLMILCMYVFFTADSLYDLFTYYQYSSANPCTRGFGYIGQLERDISLWLMGFEGILSITELVHRGEKMRLSMACYNFLLPGSFVLQISSMGGPSLMLRKLQKLFISIYFIFFHFQMGEKKTNGLFFKI